MSNPLILAVVGHTNVGKTSLLRTLTRDIHFGEVSDRPSTTRHVERARLNVQGSSLIELFDTPGLEDAIALRDYLDIVAPPQQRLDGPARLQRFLSGPEAQGRFAQEAKVLRQLLVSDAGLYVIDVREPVLPKYRDELAILADSGKPLLPVFNFVASLQSREAEWRQTLSRLGLHAAVCFDTISPPSDGEQRLYQALALLIDTARQPLSRLIADLQQQRAARRISATTVIADSLLDAAAYCRLITVEQDQQQAIATLHSDLRLHERKTIDKLIKLYKFDPCDALPADFPLLEGRFADDLFSNEALKQMGIRLSVGIAAGAAAGASIDLAVGGLTLGAATTLGALIGGMSQSIRHYGNQLVGKFKGSYKLSVDDAILSLLALRLIRLQQALEARGHAAQDQLNIDNPHMDEWKKCQLPKPLVMARAHPEWSSLNGNPLLADNQRDHAIKQLLLWLPAFAEQGSAQADAQPPVLPTEH